MGITISKKDKTKISGFHFHGWFCPKCHTFKRIKHTSHFAYSSYSKTVKCRHCKTKVRLFIESKLFTDVRFGIIDMEIIK